MQWNLKLLEDGAFYADLCQYRCLVGKLNFLTYTKPDISFVVQTLNQILHVLKTHHFHALQHLLSYIVRTVGQGILLQASRQIALQGYSDSN